MRGFYCLPRVLAMKPFVCLVVRLCTNYLETGEKVVVSDRFHTPSLL